MKRPAFQFYPGDWRNNAKLRRCSWEARGVWIECMGLMHDSDEYGVLRWKLDEIAQALGAPKKILKELVDKGVLHGCEKGLCEPMVYVPKSGRREGPAVTLIEAQQGPIWYSPRMVRDEYVRAKRGIGTQFGDGDNPSPKGGFGDGFGDVVGTTPNTSPTHRQGDGASISSSSSEIGNTSESLGTEEAATPAALSLGIACRKLRALGMTDVHPQRVELRQALSDGESIEALELTAQELRSNDPAGQPPKLKYLLAVVRGRRADAARAQPAGHTRTKHSANEPIQGRTYVGTAIDQLDPAIRASVERELGASAS